MNHAHRARTPRLAAFAGAAFATLWLTGCQSEVATIIDVTSDTTAAVTVAVTFTGEAATEMRSETNRQGLVTVFDELGDGKLDVRVQDEGDTIRYFTQAPYDVAVSASSVTGVDSISLNPLGDGAVAVDVRLVDPQRLRDSLVTAMAGYGKDQADARALVDTALQSTSVAVTVNTPANPSVSGSLADGATIDGNSVTLSQNLADFTPGTLTVTSSDTGNRWLMPVAGAAAVAAGAAVVLWLWRRRR